MTAAITITDLANVQQQIKRALDEQAAQDDGYRPLVICHPDQEAELRAVVGEKDLPVDVQANRCVPGRSRLAPAAGTVFVITALGRQRMDEPWPVLGPLFQ